MKLFLATSSGAVWLALALETDQTTISQMLNQRIAASKSGVYTKNAQQNPGIMVRTPDFFDDGGDQKVVPATLWHNDLFAPSQLYPTVSSPWCPNSGSDGFYDSDTCSNDKVGPWTFATVGVAMAGAMGEMFDDFDNIMGDNWGWGVFYASDANTCDDRCVYRQADGGWDCPGGWIDESSGTWIEDETPGQHGGGGNYYPGSPTVKGLEKGGGGAGCHFDHNSKTIDQQDAYGTPGNLVLDSTCECNYAFNGDWGEWVATWTWNSQMKSGFENRNWLNGGGNLAPAWAADTAACWVNNPRDMIQIQNQLYWQRSFWNNQKIPTAKWSDQTSEEMRKYWGWNEIPVGKWIVDDVTKWDAIFIKLPADVCNNNWGAHDKPSCLSGAAQQQLEEDLGQFYDQQKLIPGKEHMSKRPGSYILFVKEHGSQYGTHGHDDFGVNWSREFFCTNWESPNKRFKTVYEDGQCYFDLGGAPLPTPAPTPKKPPAIIENQESGVCLSADKHPKEGQQVIASKCNDHDEQLWSLEHGHIHLYTHQNLCMKVSDTTNGGVLVLSACKDATDHTWIFDGSKLFLLKPNERCLDTWTAGGDEHGVQIWDCNDHGNQDWTLYTKQKDLVV